MQIASHLRSAYLRSAHLRSDGRAGVTLARLVILAAIAIMPATARADGGVASAIYVERQEYRPDGSRQMRLEPAAAVRSGDMLVFRLTYRKGEQADDGRKLLTSAVPTGVRFTGGGDIVSVDGGRNWGRLDALWMRRSDGRMRRAVPEDVTHVRWLVGQNESRPSLLFRGQAR